MEKEINSIQIRLKPAQFVAMCRCVKDDFEAYYQNCLEDIYAEHSNELDRMEEDLDLLEGLLPYIMSESTVDAIKLLIAEFEGKISEVA